MKAVNLGPQIWAVEMTVYGKGGKRYPRFPPFPQTLEIAPRFPHSHRPGGCYDFEKSNPKGTTLDQLSLLPSGSSFDWKRLWPTTQKIERSRK